MLHKLQIVRALEGDVSLEALKEGPKARSGSTVSSSGNSSEYDSSSYNNDMKNFRRAVFNTTDYASSEYGATNEYGHTSGSSGELSVKRTSPGPKNFLWFKYTLKIFNINSYMRWSHW